MHESMPRKSFPSKRWAVASVIAIILAALLWLLSTWYSHFLSGELHLSQEITSQLDMKMIAQGYRQLMEDQGFIEAISLESLAFGYEPTAPCISIARFKDKRLVSLRIYKTSQALYESDAQFAYAGNYKRWGISPAIPGNAWFDCTTNFVLESNNVSIGIYALKKGDPLRELEDDLKMIMDAVRPRV
jgi:hypothetical protein